MAAELILRVHVDRSELNALQSEIKMGKGTTIKVSAKTSGVKQAANEVDDLDKKAKSAKGSAESLGDMLAKKIAWYAISQSVVGVVNAFKDALNTIKEVDSQLATIKKVTDFTETQMNVIKNGAYEVASAYGVAAEAYLDSVGTFAKAGYKEAAADLGELATKTQLVGDVNSSIANQFLLSVDAAWKYHGSIEQLSKVLDEANEVENNYATSIEKIAIGMPNVASIASLVGMSVEETIAALGTITAVTQQTGAKASTALRALILNITGDINSTFEDASGELVSWTADETSVMQKFLEKYAKDVMDAAQKSGELVNPIEAIRAMGQALENGEVSARDMYTELSGLGGKLRTNQLVALVENYRMIDDMLVKMGASTGSATKEINVMLDTWEAKSNILKNTFAEFVEKNLSSDTIKGLLDWATGFVKTLGTLEHPLQMAAGFVAALVAPTILKSGQQLVGMFRNIHDAINGIEVEDFTKSLASGIQSIATIAITAGLLIYNKYQEYLRGVREAAQKSFDDAKATSDKAISDAQNVQDLYDKFVVAKEAFDETEEAKQAYISSAQDLANALGIEAGAIDTTAAAMDKLGDKYAEYTKKRLEDAVSAAKITADEAQINAITLADTNRRSSNPILQAGQRTTEVYNPNAKSALDQYIVVEHSDEQRYMSMLAELENQRIKLRELQKSYSEDASEETRKELNKTQAYISEVEDVFDGAYAARLAYSKALADLTAFEQGKERASADSIEKTATAEELAAKAAQEAAEKLQKFSAVFDQITNSANNATEAIENYTEATSTDVTDNADSLATAYQDFAEQLKKGNIGSTKVKGFIDLFLSQDQINKYQGDIGKLAEYLNKDFFKQLFVTGVDEEGEAVYASGEELGQRFANVFKDQIANGTDEAGNSILKFRDKTIASLEKTANGWYMNIEDINMLSDAMGGIDPDALMMLLDAMSVKTGDVIKPTVDQIYELANAADAVHEKANDLKEIDLARIIANAFATGKSDTEVWNLVSALKEANENGDINLVIDWAIVEEADEKTRNLINDLEKAGIPITTYVDTKSIDEATDKANKLRNTVATPMNGSVTISSNVDSVLSKMQQLASMPKSNYLDTFGISHEIGASASGTDNAQGGDTLLNEEGAEIIQAGDKAWIAGGGLPTITYLPPGAKVWTAKETKEILGNKNARLLFDGINAFASGTSIPASIRNVTHNASRSSVVIGSTKSTEKLEWLKDYVALRKAEYDLAEAREVKAAELIKKEQQVQSAIKEQIEYLKKIKGSQTEIDQLTTEYYQLNVKIAEIQKGLLDNLQTAINARIDDINDKRDRELEKIDAKIEKLKEEHDQEEKTLAVEEAREKLLNAREQRTTRVYNAAKGKWENVANAEAVKSAKDALEDAKYNARLDALEQQKEAITEKYLEKTDRWQKVLEALEEPVQSIGSALKKISRTATKDQKPMIKALNKLLKPLGYSIDTSNLYDSGGILQGIGGIKATNEDEIVLPPDITSRMLQPVRTTALTNRLNELRYLYGVTGQNAAGISTTNNSIGKQINGGNFYTLGNVTLTESQARSTTIYEFVQASRGLRAYSGH